MGKSFGVKLASARIRQGFTQGELGEKVGVSQAMISHWENGKYAPNESQLQAIEEIVGGVSARVTTNINSPPNTDQDQQTLNGAFGAWLARIRTKNGLSVPQLAKRADVSMVAIYNLESGRSLNPQAETRKRLGLALGALVPEEVKNEATEEQEIKGLGSLEDFDPHDENDRPAAAGVYVFYDVSERPIYVGKAENIRKRVEQHEDKFWFKRPIVVNGAYVKIKDATLRHQVEQVLIKFLKSNAVINKQSVER